MLTLTTSNSGRPIGYAITTAPRTFAILSSKIGLLRATIHLSLHAKARNDDGSS
jgi:hypothetical protein